MASPLLARWVVNSVLPLFGPALPNTAKSLTKNEQLAPLDADGYGHWRDPGYMDTLHFRDLVDTDQDAALYCLAVAAWEAVYGPNPKSDAIVVDDGSAGGTNNNAS